ncbi:hypothetical protein VKT23_013566 [Stygiomarasmius scandens]|uniref:Heterokaryon incompatibility domain-containing protein n=1 Tax=Marasmiellus scandens TaxID=2682957 RepID=A0ABR1J5D5_9AGAR
MRLLNTKIFEIKEFYTDIPLYAILSHTWEEDEVTFQDAQDIQGIKKLDHTNSKSGWSKVKNACRYALKHDFDWIWIDSCCIDKSSSAELSEALNSMYQYYTDAEVCYVYLSDVSSKEDPRRARSKFRSSKWFTRGWTLQELIAPMYAVFLDKDWGEIGTRWSLRDAISAITTVPVDIFEGRADVDKFSIAQRMSWAADRETKRPEDLAYCLMGIFNVNMPPIYGEGAEKAFIRLQQEIIKISDDRSIFVWMSESSSTEERGLLARSPREFRASGQVSISNTGLDGNKASFSFGNNGLRIHLPLVPTKDSSTENPLFLASLHCQKQDISGDNYLSVYLRKIGKQQFVRCRLNQVVVSSSQTNDLKEEVIIKENSLPRRIRRKGGVTDYNSFVENTQFEPTSAAKRLFDVGKRTNILAKTSAIFVQIKDEGDEFTCMCRTNRSKLDTTAEVIQVGIVKWVPHISIAPHRLFDDSPADRVQSSLKRGLLDVRLHVGSGNRKVEIDHKVESKGCMQLQPLQPPSWICMVPLAIPMPRGQFSFENVYPEKFLDRGLDRGLINQRLAYMAWDTNEHRLLTYRWKDELCHIVVGFHKSGKAWIDISRQNSSNWQDIWESYCDPGVRENSASIELNGYKLTAIVNKFQYGVLELGSHSILFKYAKKV